MATVTENTLKMTEGSDVYILRPMILSDKTFFTETMAEFPYEAEGINPSRTFDKYMYQWAHDSQDSDLPVQKGELSIKVFVVRPKSMEPIGNSAFIFAHGGAGTMLSA